MRRPFASHRSLFVALGITSIGFGSLLLPSHASGQTSTATLDTIRAGRFDAGKMWTFEYAPSEYFTETYGFDADGAWFERARMAAVRIPGCSASFVSPNGLLATNHHCVRGRVAQISREGEGLLDNGFYAASADLERRIPGYYADQLLATEDVSEEVFKALEGAEGEGGRTRAREAVFENIRSRLLDEYGSAGEEIWVQMIALYNGGRYSAYVFRRFTDIRLVFAVELETGFFGGDPDNFTYPRYALDFAFLRAYGSDGEPYLTEHYFDWGAEGVEEGDVVFVIGNPGSTTRGTTMAQLEFLRDAFVPAQRQWYESRHGALGEYRKARPEEAEAWGVRNRMFSLSNSLKATVGRLEALHKPVIMARRAAAEHALREAIAERPELAARYGGLFDRMAEIQEAKVALAAPFAAFYRLGSPTYSSATVLRALAAADYLIARDRGGLSADSLGVLYEQVREVRDNPPELERRMLAARLADFTRYLDADDEIARLARQDGTPEATAASLLAHSKLSSAQDAAAALEADGLDESDPAVRLAMAILPEARAFGAAYGPLIGEEQALAGDFGRVRFEVYGRSVPPDGTSSPRITDGVVSGYEYNGTLAPPYTTFYGLYDRHYSHRDNIEWALPERWRTPPPGLDLGTPLNFASTADTYGGNSGSPAVTPELELVGLNFDRNVNGLSRDYIYLPEQGRNVMVDVRAIQAALDYAYDADRIVQELLTGQLFRTEQEADASR
jgi:hypothetical protein